MTTLATLEPAALEVLPGGEATCRLTVRNAGDIVEGYNLEVVGAPAPWTVLDPLTIRLYPGAETTVTVAFRPPRAPWVAAGDVPYAVRVLPIERPQDAVAAEGAVRVLAFAETTAEIVPRTSKGRRGARHEVAVDNRGNVPLTAHLAGGDPDGQLKVAPRPATLVVPPGQAAFAAVAVRHRRRLWRGQPVTRPFQVAVAHDDGPPILLDASTLQLPIISKTAMRVAAGTVAVVALLAAAWFLLLKPAVKSAATDAVNQPLAKVAQQADNADKKAGQAQQDADKANKTLSDPNAPGGTGKTPGPQPAPPSPPPGTTTQPFTSRLQNVVGPGGNTGTTGYTVPAKTTFAITDLVLENPQGDTGRLDVLVDGREILTLALANFRDLDYHFVSPIQVGAGKTLSIRTTCLTNGPVLAGTSGDQCRTLVFASGTQITVNTP